MPLTNLNLDTLRTLVEAYDLGGFGQAAERLGRTPSAISLQMKRLQEDVGAPLFRKDGRTFALTEIGEIVLSYGRRILELNDELLHTVQGASLAGQVRIGLPQDFAETILPQALAQFARLYPLVQIEVKIDGNAALAEAVEKGQLDVALIIGHADRPMAQKVGELKMVWIAGENFSRRDDQDLPLVLLGPQCIFRRTAVEALNQAGIGWRIALVSPSLAGLWAAATAGLGITVRSNFGLPKTLTAGTTLFGLPELPSIPVSLHLKDKEGHGATERFAEILRDLVAHSQLQEQLILEGAQLDRFHEYCVRMGESLRGFS